MNWKTLAIGVAGAGTLAASAASPAAAVTFTTDPNLGTLAPDQTIFCDFETDECGVTGDFLVKSGSSSTGASLPGNSSRYLAVPGLSPYDNDRTAVLSLAEFASNSFSFDWGSIDTYNTVTLLTSDGGIWDFTGDEVISSNFGNQTSAISNLRFNATTQGSGVFFTEVRFKSTSQAFEIDNLGIGSAVPEPTTWAMLILGLFGIGSVMRRKKLAHHANANAQLITA